MSRTSVFRALQAQEGVFLSSKTLSAELGISRTAVWKSVCALRAQGYAIEGRLGMGYRLFPDDRLTGEKIETALGAPRAYLHVLQSTGSTNTDCRRLAMDGAPDGTVVIAEEQTAGRGRLGRSFQSKGGMGLYLSVLWRPDVEPEELLPLTALTAVAAAIAIEQVTGTRPQIKWPNDLVLHGKKLAGILTELVLEEETLRAPCVVVGIGINCHQKKSDFADEVAEIATSLDAALGIRVDRATLAAALLKQLEVLRHKVLCAPEKWLTAYRENCLTIGKQVQLLQTGESVTALNIDDRYGLIVRTEEGICRTYRSGEVSVRGFYGYAE